MSFDMHPIVRETLPKFDFVQWDRFVSGQKSWAFYGWIKREDAHEDFLVLEFSADKDGVTDIWFLTSSKEYDPQIRKILGDEGDAPCQRVEHFFDIPNMIRLKP